MAKYENIRALAKKQLQTVTESSDRWKAFLRTAAIAYNYSFPNQLLIHEQSPTATAVADIAYWNNNAGRWVKRGAHGIAVFDTRANSSRLRYLFDISDTIPRAEVPDALPWVITDQNWRPVWDKIVADNHADSIQSALLMLSTSCVAQRSAMFTTALEKAIDGSNLQWAKPDEQRQLFIQLITQSCLYMAALRCGVDTARLDLSALESVNQFDTNRIALCLGSACQQAARPLMQQIGSITREIDSVARAEKVRYYGDKQEETNNTKEVNNGVHDGERLPNPGADVERAADAGNREVRQPAAEIPAGERADGVRRDAVGGNAVPASGGDGQRSTPANRADDADADAAEHRPEPADRPDGLDAVDERLAEPSRGTGDAADLQPVIQEPQAESDTTPSAFSVPISDLPPLSDELILGLLAKESSSRADNAAILEYFNEHPDLAERSAFCKHCYKQIYTYLFVDDHTVGFIRHDMYLELWEGNYLTKTAQVNLTWDAVAAKIADLIEQGRLMVPIKATPVQQQMEQLTLTPEDSEKAGLPSHEQQAKNIDLAAEVKKWNKPVIDASGKYITEQDITDALCKGGGFEDSKFRIQQYLSAQVLPIEEDQARWLKKEYGIGGGTWFFRDGGRGFLNHMGKNLEITRRTEDGEYRRVLKWKEVAQRLRLLVYNDQYLTDAEKAPYQAWAAEQQAARAANDAALAHAKHAITDFCENEGLNEPNFSDLTRVEFAYSTTEDDEHEIQVYANLLRNEIRYEVDGNIVHIDYFQDNHELAAQGIENSAFSDFINTAEAEFEKHHPTSRKVEKSPVTIGSTVYLEDDRPFTVEEIGRENIHLRDESFPLVGRAVSHEEFARLLAANPKNAALSAPEVPSRQEQPEETAEPIVGKVIEEPSPFVAQVMADAERLSAEDEPYHREPITYEAPYLDNLPTAPREKFAANIAAIQKLKEIEQRVANGGSPAFEDEQKILAQYTGWGGLSDAFDPNKSAWSNEYSQLKAALSESEYEAARSSTLTAFYTPATVIHPIYRALERFGVKGGKILEPSMGTGAFLAHGHFGSSDAKFYGVELDSITGRISKQLYQKANIQVTGYENALLPGNYFDCVIGNVPFGNFQVNDPQYNRLHFPIHDYFFAKSIDKLRTGGIMAIITSSGTLDKKDDRARKYIAERCDLIGAVRLPNNAFKGSGTKIMTDVIFLQKRDTLRQQDEPWLHLAEDANGITMNRYFVEHPEMICGRMEIVSGPYGPASTCQPIDPDAVDRFGKPLLETQIDAAMQHLTATLTKAEIPIQEESGEDTKYIDADPFVRNFSYTVKDDKIYYREGAVMRECNPNAASAERIRKLVELRDTTRALIDAQLQDLSDEEIHRLQTQLNRQYDAFRAKHGLINSRSAELSFRDDSSYYLLCSLENVDEKGNFISKSDMFTKRTIRSAQIPDHADTASDALALSIGERAKVDMPYMMHLTGKDEAKLIERGIPETEIAFIHEANTDARKTELFGKVRSGAVRVLMGSTAKMGAGTNVQQRLVALHHLDVPWRPSDIEQREGRILRQGNENKEVYVFRYVTEGTFDAYSWQLIENKQKFIGQIMTSKSPARSCDDMDEAALSYAEVKALAAGNPLIKEKMDLDVQLTRLKTLKAAHDSQRYELENKIAIGFPAEIRKCKEQIENATVDAATVKEHSVVDADGKDVFCIQLEKKVYYEKEPAGKALLGLLGLALNSEKPVPIGYFKGMELQIQHLPFGNGYHARLAGSGTYSTQLGADVLGNLTRLSNLANGIEPSIEKTRNMQIQLEQQLASAEKEVKRPFPQATELTEKSKRLAVLEGLLNMNDKDIVTDTEPEQQCQTDNRQRGQEER